MKKEKRNLEKKGDDRMPYIAPELIIKAKEIDLLTYLKHYEPNELVKESQKQYCTKTHNSLKISNGYWNWFSRGIGGRNALDYLIKVKGYSFISAVETILKQKQIQVISNEKNERNKKTQLILPEKNINNERAICYLISRCINEEIIQKCIEKNLIYEEKHYHNIVFIGYDENNIPRYAGCRATDKSKFKSDATGSDKGYSFKLESEEETDTIYVFEGAIDLLSYASFLTLYGMKWEDKTMISLAGVYQPSKIIEQSKVPKVLVNYLEKHPKIKKIILCLDNDQAGRNATKALKIVLQNKYEVVDKPPKYEKDYNDYLCKFLSINKQKNRIERER